jgi:hypothetical protein
MWRWLAVAGACLMAAAATQSASAAPVADGTPIAPGPVVVVGVPDLRWQDVDPTVTPALWGLAGRASVAAMTDNSGEGLARRAAGWLTVNTGSRAVADVEPGTVPDPAVPAQLQALRTANRSARYDAQVGALGDAVHRAGLALAAVGGPGAVLGAMTRDGTVDSVALSVGAAMGHGHVVVVELPQLYQVGRLDADAAHHALTTIDTSVGVVLRGLPEGASLLVAGVSDGASGPPHLHVAMAIGPSFDTGLLTSASTGRTGVVQLIDVAPTVVGLAGADAPSSMLGVRWRTVPDSGARTAEHVSAFVGLDRRSVSEMDTERWYYPFVALLGLLYVAAALTAWTLRRTHLLRPVGAVVACVPVASFLAQLGQWWRAGSWLLVPLTVGVAVVLGSVAVYGPWTRHGQCRTAGFVGAVTAGVIVVDACTGSPLSLDAPFGDNPIIAGRFHGIGNVAFALLGAGTLVLSAAVATGEPTRRAAAVVLGSGAVAVAVDGHPALGDDFGGVLALLPAVAVLGLVVSRVRISARHALAVLVATVTTTAAFALYDYARPPSQRTHLGRFIGQIADGSAGSVIARKLDSSLASFTTGWHRWLVVGWLVVALAVYVGHRLGWMRVPSAVDHRTAGGLLAALLVLAILGAGLNDSGLAITAFTFYVAAPLLVPLVARVHEPPSLTTPDREVSLP